MRTFALLPALASLMVVHASPVPQGEVPASIGEAASKAVSMITMVGATATATEAAPEPIGTEGAGPVEGGDVPGEPEPAPGDTPQQPSRWRIHPNGDMNMCLDASSAKASNGLPVEVYKCNPRREQLWQLSPGGTQVKLSGTNFCLDAGENPGDGTKMKLWECYDNLPAQSWWATEDSRIALTSAPLCLDLPEGKHEDGVPAQVWTCSDRNPNQMWLSVLFEHI